jgi:hypothetical protein
MLTTVRCPLCRRPAPWEGNLHRPFCSERCKLHDLGNWASERYRIPGPSPDAAGQSESEAETDKRGE